MAQRMTGIEVGREGYRSAQEAGADVPVQLRGRIDEIRDHPLCQWPGRIISSASQRLCGRWAVPLIGLAQRRSGAENDWN